MLQRLTLPRAVRMLLIAVGVGVCLAPLYAQDPTATVVVQSGQVSVTWDGRDMQALSSGMVVKPQQVIVTGPDGFAQFQVSDGSTFEVFSDTRLVFRPTLGNWRDLLNVVLGRVKVFITHPNGRVNYNDVRSPTAVISVRGTVFDVVVEDADGTTLVTLDEGLVDVRSLLQAGPAVQLHPGEFIRVWRDQKLGAVRPDKGNLIRMAQRAAQDAAWQIFRGQHPGVAGSSPGAPGSQGDKGKPTTGTPGAPPQPGGH